MDDFEIFSEEEEVTKENNKVNTLENVKKDKKDSINLDKRQNKNDDIINIIKNLNKSNNIDINIEKPIKKEIVCSLENIGYEEDIFQLSELYLPKEKKTIKNVNYCIDIETSLVLLKEFENSCALAPFELNEAIENFKNNLKDKPIEIKKSIKKIKKENILNRLKNKKIIKYKNKYYNSNIKSKEFYTSIFKNLCNEFQTNEVKFQNINDLLRKQTDINLNKIIKNINQEVQSESKEKEEEELEDNNSNFNPYNNLFKNDSNEDSDNDFDFLKNSMFNTSNVNHNLNDNIFEEENDNKNCQVYDIKNDEYNVINEFKINKKKDELYTNNFDTKLNINQIIHENNENIFNYNMIDNNKSINFQINEEKKISQNNMGNNYQNLFLNKNFLDFENEEKFEIFKKCPYFDLNHPDYNLIIKLDKNKDLKNIFEDPLDDKINNILKESNFILNENDMQKFKKLIRMLIAKNFRLEDLSEKMIKEILDNPDSDIGKILNLEKNSLVMQNIEIMKNKKRKIRPIKHSILAYNFKYENFFVNKTENKNMLVYRYDFRNKFIRDIFEKIKNNKSVEIINKYKENKLKKILSKRTNNLLINSLQNNEEGEIVESHEIFNSLKNLSLSHDEFVLIEYIEKEPLILSHFGMCSRVQKLLYPSRVMNYILEEKNKINDYKNSKGKLEFNEKIEFDYSKYKKIINDNLGTLGEEIWYEDNEKFPLLGQISSSKYIGLTILENNLSKTPIFPQKKLYKDYVLVCLRKNNEWKYYLRKIKKVYVAGQIQPKMEIFSPYSKLYQNFTRKFIYFYIKNAFEYNDEKIYLDSLKKIFPTINDHNLKKQIKLMGGEQEVNNPYIFYKSKNYVYEQEHLLKMEDFDNITPEELCLHERMFYSLYKWQNFGIYELKSSDKINVLKTKFYRKNLDDPFKCLICRKIIEEIHLTSWNVSQSFLNCAHNSGRMQVVGYGDPTNNNGGISYIRLPLKISRYESELLKLIQKQRPNTMVTGTDSDLRRLQMKFVDSKLKKYGYSYEVLTRLERWDRVEILRQLANDYMSKKNKFEEVPGKEPIVDKDLEKFARSIRMTTEKQKEKYNVDINKMFMKLIDNLIIQDDNQISDFNNEYHFYEPLTKLLKYETEEIERYKQIKINDEEEKGTKKRSIPKNIVLKDRMKKQ